MLKTFYFLFLLIFFSAKSYSQEFSDPSRTEFKDDAGLQASKSGFFQTASPINYPAGAGSWWHLLDVRHTNTANNFAMQFAGSFFDQNLYFRKTNNNPSQAWSRVLLETNGFVGIGTTTPEAKLTLSGTSLSGTGSQTNISAFTGNGLRINASSSVNSQDGITYQSGSAGGGAGIAFGRNAGWDTWMSFYTNSNLNPGTGNIIERLRIIDNGNVGIATTNPQALLEIAHNGASSYGTILQLKTTAGSDGPRAAFEAFNGGSPKRWNVGMRNQGTSFGIFEDGYSGGFGTERVTVLPGGNVGIGTTNPLSALHTYTVNSTARNTVTDAITLGGTSSQGVPYNGFGQAIAWYGRTYLNGTERVLSRIYSQLNDQSNSTNGTSLVFQTTNAGDVLSTPTTKMIINHAGNVGIGTTNPGTMKLAVEGTIGARKVMVTQAATWPDFVFKEEYHLRSLTDLEIYIKKYSHLPDVPSAKEIEKGGLDVGSTQAVLLKKIEELTLYVIEQQKEIQQLKLEVKQVKQSK